MGKVPEWMLVATIISAHIVYGLSMLQLGRVIERRLMTRFTLDEVERRRHADLTRALGRESLPTGQTGPPSRIGRADMRAARIDEEGDLQ